MEEFPPNSLKAADAQRNPKRVERVTSAQAVRRKRGLGRQFKDAFIVGSAREAIHYMITDVIVPSAQDALIEAVQAGFERMVRGEGARPRYGSSGGSGYAGLGHIAYNRMSSSPATPASNKASTPSRAMRARNRFDDIVISSRTEANDVIDQMFTILSQTGSVSVADLYEMTDIQGSHTDLRWGWRDLRGAKATPLRTGGFLLEIPDPQPL